MSRFATVFKLACVLVLSLLLWEVVLEATIVRYPGSAMHPAFGTIIRSGWYLQGLEGFGVGWFNSHGMRHPELTPRRPGVRRILVIGDSHTEAMQVMPGATYVAQLERRLSADAGRPVEVVNGGRMGAALGMYAHLADTYVQLVAPDEVVIQTNRSDLNQDLFDDQKTIYLKAERGRFSTVANRQFRSTNPLTQRFSALQGLVSVSALRQGTRLLPRWLGNKPEGPRKPDGPGRLEPQERAALAWLCDVYRAKYRRVTLVYLPLLTYEGDEPTPEVEREFAAIARAAGLSFVSMREPFKAHFRATQEPLNGFHNTRPGKGHINEAGHRLVADALYAALGQRAAAR